VSLLLRIDFCFADGLALAECLKYKNVEIDKGK